MITPAQRKLLAQAVKLGTTTVNGRRMLAAEGLKVAGFATTDTWIEGGQDGGRWQVKVTPTTKGLQYIFDLATSRKGQE